MSVLLQPSPARERYHIELVDGRELEKPMPKNLHAWIQTYLIITLAKLLPDAFEPLSELNVLTGTRTVDGRPEYICPDVQVARKTARYEEGILAEPPELGVEILSPGQTITELFGRADRLVKLGAPNVWVIWPEKRRAWEVGSERIEEVQSKLTLNLPSDMHPQHVTVDLADMWKVLDRTGLQ